MVRRWVGALLLMELLLGGLSPFGVSAEPVQTVELHSEDAHVDIRDISAAPDGRHVAVLAGDAVQVRGADFAPVTSVALPPEGAWSAVACANEGVWVYDETARRLSEYDFNGAWRRDLPALPDNAGDAREFAVMGGALMFRGGGQGEFDPAKAWIIDPVDDAPRPLLLAYPVFGYSVTRGRAMMWCFTGQAHRYIAYDPSGGEATSEYEIEGSPSAFAADEVNRYWIEGRTLYRAPHGDDASRAMACFPEGGMDRKLLMLGDSVAVWPLGGCEVQVVPKDHVAPEKVLRLAGTEAYDYEAAARLTEAFPEYRVEMAQKTVHSAEPFLTALMSKDPGVDIFYVSSAEQGARQMIEKGFFTDLTTSELLREDARGWYPKMREFCSRDGKLFGYPWECFGQALICDDLRLKEYKVELDEDMTWARFFEVIERAERPDLPVYQANAYFHASVLEGQLLSEYFLGKPVTREAVRQFLEALAYPGENALITREWRRLDALPETVRLDYIDEAKTGLRVAPVPTLTGKGEVPVTVWWMIVNPYSTQREVALRFIEEHAKMRQETGGVGQWTLIAPDQLEKLRSLAQGDDERIVGEMAHYDQWMDRLTVCWASPLDQSAQNIIDQYTAGTIELDEATDNLYDRLQLLMLEQGVG